MEEQIRLLQFVICKDFKEDKRDSYSAEAIHSNIYASKFPLRLDQLCVVTCWRKDKKFHKEVIEYQTAYGNSVRTPHMDIEPVSDSVLFRWHKHPFPHQFTIEKPTVLTVRVILDGAVKFESYLLIENKISEK
jgi:hypothetical protein